MSHIAPLAAAVVTICILPPILLGAVAVRLDIDIGISSAQLGLAVSVFFASGAVVSTVARLIGRRVPPRTGMGIGLIVAAMSMIAISFAQSVTTIVIAASAAGAGNAVAYVSNNLFLTSRLEERHQPVAFGAMQAGIPFASVLAGFAVPTIALGMGWRWVFRLAAAVAVGCVLATRSVTYVPLSEKFLKNPFSTKRNAGSILALAGAAMLGSVGASSVNTFFVKSGVEHGIPEGTAALWLAFGGAIAIAFRLGAGWIASDRLSASSVLGLLAGLLLAGSVGLWLLPLGSIGMREAFFLVLLFGGVWGWPGLMNYAVVVRHHEAIAMAAGISQAGVYAGAVLGPSLFGSLLAGSASFDTSWTLMSLLTLVGALLVSSLLVSDHTGKS